MRRRRTRWLGSLDPLSTAAFHRTQVGLDEIQPAGVGWERYDGDPMGPVERAQDGMPMRVEVIHEPNTESSVLEQAKR